MVLFIGDEFDTSVKRLESKDQNTYHSSWPIQAVNNTRQKSQTQCHCKGLFARSYHNWVFSSLDTTGVKCV